MSFLLTTQILLTNRIASRFPYLTPVQRTFPDHNGLGPARANPYRAYPGPGHGWGWGWGGWWWVWVAIALIIVAIVAFGWMGNSSSRRSRRQRSGMEGPLRPTGVSPVALVDTAHVTADKPAVETHNDTSWRHAWIGFAIAVVIAIFVAGFWWWGADGSNGNYYNPDGYSAEVPGHYGNGGTLKNGGNSPEDPNGSGNADAEITPPPPTGGMTGAQLAARPIWA